MQSPPIRRSG